MELHTPRRQRCRSEFWGGRPCGRRTSIQDFFSHQSPTPRVRRRVSVQAAARGPAPTRCSFLSEPDPTGPNMSEASSWCGPPRLPPRVPANSSSSTTNVRLRARWTDRTPVEDLKRPPALAPRRKQTAAVPHIEIPSLLSAGGAVGEARSHNNHPQDGPRHSGGAVTSNRPRPPQTFPETGPGSGS